MILVTGSNGFLGRNLIMTLINSGMEVLGVDYSYEASRNLEIRADVTTSKFLDLVSDYRFDIIIHLASPCSVIQFNRDPEGSILSTLRGFYNIIKVSKMTGARVIYPSSGTVYNYEGHKQRESDIPNPPNLYGITKVWAETLMRSSGIESTGLRIFAGYGPHEERKGDLASVVTLFLNDLLENKAPTIWGNGNQKRDFVYVNDIIKAFMTLIKKDYWTYPIINIGSGTSTSFSDLVEILSKSLGKNITPLYVPRPSNYIEATEADISIMRNHLEIDPIPLGEGVKKLTEYRIGLRNHEDIRNL